MELEIKTAAELVEPELEAWWSDRRADRRGEVFQYVLRRFIAQEGSIPMDEVRAAFPDDRCDTVRSTLATLDEKDLIQLRAGRVELAYPFSALPTSFVVIFSDGRERYACCAIDALGIPAMLGQGVRIRSRCHHCGEPLEFSADPRGPARDAREVMVWVGRRREGDRRISTSL